MAAVAGTQTINKLIALDGGMKAQVASWFDDRQGGTFQIDPFIKDPVAVFHYHSNPGALGTFVNVDPATGIITYDTPTHGAGSVHFSILIIGTG